MINRFNKLIIVTCTSLIINSVYGANKKILSNNLNELNSQIQQINQSLSSKQQQKQQLDKALKNSKMAIIRSENLLKQLNEQRNNDLAQLSELAQSLPQLNQATEQAKNTVNAGVLALYQQIQQLQQTHNTLLNDNQTLEQERKKIYIINLLRAQQQKFIQLNKQLDQLQQLNQNLQLKINNLNQKLGFTSKQYQQLLESTTQTKQQAIQVKQQIIVETSKLSNLKQQQQQLNSLLKNLLLSEQKDRQQRLEAQKQAKQKKKSQRNSNTQTQNDELANKDTNNNIEIQTDKIDNSFTDNSPFLKRKLAKPLQGKISVGFGQIRDSVKNMGILFNSSDNSPIHAISNGTVLFSDNLPGFGQIVVIDHGDNYNSVYSGILAKVTKGSKVQAGQVIGTSGNENNQPMGGVYFELRHLGKPINPTKLVS
ncbi:MAG: hypothetical protein RLZZ293_655 [Pseudomonadota bacterium]|jgi:septal ring factor EnvC (AmiA/AmiB activator)